MPRAQLLTGDALTVLRTLPSGSVRCCITSPPYWGLRDYGQPGQLGLERTPEEYVARLVEVFREVRRVLADDGTLWLNLGDSYAAHPNQRSVEDKAGPKQLTKRGSTGSPSRHVEGLKAKDLVGIPWSVAFALRADGWYLRSEIIWSKANPMPESVTDRPTKAHEQVFLLSKRASYFYDAATIAEPVAESQVGRVRADVVGGASHAERGQHSRGGTYHGSSFNRGKTAVSGNGRNQPDDERADSVGLSGTRNARTVWEIATQPYAGAHFATFPEELARRCILAGSAPSDTVLDPFSGSGTVASVAVGNGRAAIGIELNPKYQELALHRIGPLLASVEAA